MSDNKRFSQLRDVRSWKVDDVVSALKNNGLAECAEACQKREVDGETLLGMSEFALRMWGRDLNVGNMRKLSSFIQDVNENPGKYILSNNASNNDDAWDTDWEDEPEEKVLRNRKTKSKNVTQNVDSSMTNGMKSNHPSSDQNGDTKPQGIDSASHVPKKLIPPPIFNNFNLSKNVNGNDSKPSSSLRRPQQSQNNSFNGGSLKYVSPPRQQTQSNVVNENNPKPFSEFQQNFNNAVNRDNEKPVLPFSKGQVQQNGNFGEKKPLLPPPSTKPQLPARPAMSPFPKSLSPQPPLSQLPFPPKQTPLPQPPTQQPMLSKPSIQQTALPQPPIQQTALPQPPIQQMALPQPPIQQTALPRPPFQPTVLPQPPFQQTTLPRPPFQQTTLPRPPFQQTTLPRPPFQQTTQPRPPFQQTTLPRPPFQQTTQPRPPFQQTTQPRPPFQPPLPKPPIIDNDELHLRDIIKSIPYEPDEYVSVDEDLLEGLDLKQQSVQISPSKGNYPHVEVPAKSPSRGRSPVPLPPALREETSFLHSSLTNISQFAAMLNQDLPPREPSPVLYPRAHPDFSNRSSAQSADLPEEEEVVYESIPGDPNGASSCEYTDGYLPPIKPILAPELPPKTVYVVEEPKQLPKLQKSDSYSSTSSSLWSLNSLKKKTSPNNTLQPQEKSLTPDGKKSSTPTLSRPSHAIPEQRQNVPRPLPPTPDASESNQRLAIKIPLVQMPWYFKVDRKKGEEILRNYGNGTFMVRPSTQTQNPLTLTLKYNERTFNIVVRHRPDGRYALGTEKLTEENFSSVEELVNHYMNSELALFSNGKAAGSVTLTSPPRKDNAYL